MNTTQTPITPRDIAEALAQLATNASRTTTEGVLVHDSTLANDDGPSLLTNVDDPTGPNTGRSFIITVREVDPDAEVIVAQIETLTRKLAAASSTLEWAEAHAMAEHLILTGGVLV